MLSHKATELKRVQALFAKSQEELDALSAKNDMEKQRTQE